MKPMLACLCVVTWANLAAAFPPSEDTLLKRVYVTRTYDVDFVGSSPYFRTIDEVVSVLRTIALDRKAKPGAHEFVEREGPRLDIRATVGEHMLIRRVLQDLGHRREMAIDLKAALVEFDADGFEKQVKRHFVLLDGTTARATAVVEETVARAVVKAGKLVQDSSKRHENKATVVASARQFMVFQATEGRDPNSTAPALVKDGYRLTSTMTVSPDRRFVRMKLNEESRETERREPGDRGGFVGVDAKRLLVPREVEFGKSATVEVPDGDAVLFKLDYAPKDKVWVVVLRPVIFIQAEHDARNGKK